MKIAGLLIIFLVSAPLAFGQLIETNLWSRGVQVVLVNDTADRKVCQVELDGGALGAVQPGQSAPIFRYRGLHLITTEGFRRELSVVVKVCGTAESFRNFYAAPSWMLDARIVGGANANLLSDGFLIGNPSEKEVEKRVGVLKKYLDSKKILGRGDLKRQADVWLAFVRKNGVERSEISCESPVAVSTQVWVQGSAYDRARTTTLLVRGERGRYWIERH